MQTCNTCGGSVERVGNYYICEYCGNKWEIDAADDVHAVDRANAWAALRDGDFEKAADLFEGILLKEKKNHEAYWGRALARAGIVYVTDLREDKKVPTCNNITEASFLNGEDVQKAIALAPEDLADSYRKQAEYIEKVRVEWLEKASKEPAYDVFISFKDSDRENGIERTQDSIDAQDLYNALIAEGYKVFFSRISLRDKIAEQYEPYIYNAIKTAKVMIVFGEKPEYFSAVWLKNEWSRFKARIEKGEKHKNSLVVVYKNMNPGDLPTVLKSRQCLNASDMTFLSDLTKHIRRVVEESKQSVHLDRIEIAGGQIAKKAASLKVNEVRTHEVGAGAIAETSISEKQSIGLIRTYLEERQWGQAAKMTEDVLFDNPSCAEAIWCALLAAHKAASDNELAKKINELTETDLGAVEKTLNCASKPFAGEILKLLYASEPNANAEAYAKLLETVLPFAFEQRSEQIAKAFDATIGHGKYEPFLLLLRTLESGEVDAYIARNAQYAEKTRSLQEREECLRRILEVDEGNLDARRSLTRTILQAGRPSAEATEAFEALLKYSPDAGQEVSELLGWLGNNLSSGEHCAFAKQLLRYYPGKVGELKEQLGALSGRMIERGFFTEAEYFVNLILSADRDNADAYWKLCLIRTGARSEADIPEKNVLLKNVPEFNKYLTLVPQARQKACIQISQQQEARFAEAKEKLEEKKAEAERKLDISRNDTNSGTILKGVGLILAGLAAAVISLILAVYPCLRLGEISNGLGLLCIVGFCAIGIVAVFFFHNGRLRLKKCNESKKQLSAQEEEVAKLEAQINELFGEKP